MTKKLIHYQVASLSSYMPYVVTNHAYIDTLPFDGIVVIIDDTQALLGASYSGTYATLYAQMSPMIGLFNNVTHNYVSAISGNILMQDPFDDWTASTATWVNLATAARDTGLEGIFYDPEEYNVNIWDYSQGSPKYVATKTLSQYQEQWRLRGTQVAQAILAQWPTFKLLMIMGPNRSVNAAPYSGAYSGSPNFLSGYFFAGLFAGAPNNIIDGGEHYYDRTALQFSTWRDFERNVISQSPYSPPLVPSNLLSTWQAQMSNACAFYDQDLGVPIGSTVMSPSVLRTTIVNAAPYVDEIMWNYSESLDWLTPTVDPIWVNAVLNARRDSGLSVNITPVKPMNPKSGI